MRTLDKQDDENTAFGAPIKKPEMPQPHRKVTADGSVRQTPEGKYYTLDPKNEAAKSPTIWELYGIQRTTP